MGGKRFYRLLGKSILWASVEIDLVGMCGNRICEHVWKSTWWAGGEIDFVGMCGN